MSKPVIYLAGPITGLTYNEACDWRRSFAELMGPDYHCLSPMRSREVLREIGPIPQTQSFRDDEQLEIFHRDSLDVRRADCLVANLSAGTFSVGTIIELAWAYALGKPTVVIATPNSSALYRHTFIQGCIGWARPDLFSAANVVKEIFDVRGDS